MNLGHRGIRGSGRLPALAAALLTISGPAPAQDSAVTAQLQAVQVTGSRIRRVDRETASPVLSLSARELTATGAQTLGEILQQLPLAAGTQANAQYNYPPSGGVSEIGLRGLTSARTLLLLDGRRLATADVNQIPLALIERVEVLKQGASAVYGSDAIAGVVNIITRKKLRGLEAGAGYGQSQRGDDRTQQYSLLWGDGDARGNLVAGALFNGNSPVHARDRWWAAQPYGFADGQVADLQQGSVAVPNGFIVLPVNAILGYGCPVSAPILTRIDGAAGSARSDYRCFNYAPSSAQGSDLYNYQTENYLLPPSWHAQGFMQGDYRLNEDLRLFGQLLYSHAHARNQQAPEAFNLSVASLTLGTPVMISAQSAYNPFGVDIGRQYSADIFSTLYLRTQALGDRIYTFDKDFVQGSGGVRGTLLDRYEWSLVAGYGYENTGTQITGIPRVDTLPQALGPSFIASDGTPTCGTRLTPIAGCTPVDLLGAAAAGQQTLQTTLHNQGDNTLLNVSGDITGPLASLWAGDLSAELGYDFRRYGLQTTPDPLAQQFLLFEGNQQATTGSYTVNEVYGELLLPLLHELPGAHQLSLSYGLRASKYSTFDSTLNNKYALEWRPVRELLLRATYADIFRAPTIQDLYGGASEDAPSYTDPCNGLTTPQGQNANVDAACAGVSRNGNYQQYTTQAGALVTSTPTLQPESGYTTDFGLVYSPAWFTPLSIEADYFHYTVDNAITRLNLQDSLNACYSYGEYCGNIARDPTTGQLVNGTEPRSNAARFATTGLDAGLHLQFADHGYGRLLLTLDGTYLQKFDYELRAPAGQPLSSASVAGQYNALVFDGGFPRLRATARAGWSRGAWSLNLTDSYIGNVNENVPANGTSCPDGSLFENNGIAQCSRSIGSANYVSLAASYQYKPWNTQLTLGVDDLFDEQAQLAYSAPVPDTVLSLYNVVGRAFYARVLWRIGR